MMMQPCLSTALSFTSKAFAGSSTLVVAYLCSADAVKFIIPAFMTAPEKHRSLLQDLRGRQALHDVKPHVFYWRRQPWPWAAHCQGWLVTSGQDDPLRAQHPSKAVNSEMDHLNSQLVSRYLQQGSDMRQSACEMQRARPTSLIICLMASRNLNQSRKWIFKSSQSSRSVLLCHTIRVNDGTRSLHSG